MRHRSQDRGAVAAAPLLALLLAVPACAAPAVTAPLASEPPSPRKPDGVVLEPAPLVPSASVRAKATGVRALREPAGEDAVAALVEGLVDGWTHESLDALLALTTADAGLLEGPDHGHAALVEAWRQRLHAHEYGRLAGAEVVRPERVERWEWEELGAPAGPPRPAGMRPGDLLVRAPVEITRVAGERVFGDVMTLIVRRQDGRLRIAGYAEGDAP